MNQKTEPAKKTSRPKASNELDHLFCCDEDVSLCSLDISDLPITKRQPNPCVVCFEMESTICPICGE